VPREDRRPRGGGRRNRTSRACLSGARAALGLGDCILHCWGSITLRNVRQHYLSSNPRRRELPFPLADLLGHHGGYVTRLMAENQSATSAKWTEEGARARREVGREPRLAPEKVERLREFRAAGTTVPDITSAR